MQKHLTERIGRTACLQCTRSAFKAFNVCKDQSWQTPNAFWAAIKHHGPWSKKIAISVQQILVMKANPRRQPASKRSTKQCSISLCHSILLVIMRIPLLDYQIIIMPNILGSIIPQLIINQQGFWTLLDWPWRPHRWIKNIISCALTVLAVYFLFAFGSGGSEGPNGSALYLLRASFAAASSCWPTSALLKFRKILGLQTLENLK